MISNIERAKLQSLPIEQVAMELGIEVRNHKAICTFHEDKHPSLSFHLRSNRYRCFVCGENGGVIDLVMNTQKWNFKQSCIWLAERFGIILGNKDNFRTIQAKTYQFIRREPAPEEKPDIEYLSRLMAQPVINIHAASFLYGERKIQQEIVDSLGLSSISYSCPMSSVKGQGYFDGPALLIPYRDYDGRLISVQSRYLGKENRPRFRFPKGSHCHVFNTQCLKGLDPKEPVFITEGVTDCLALLSAGLKSIAIPSATLLKREDVECFKDRNLHMYPDADEPGQKLFDQIKTICPQLVKHDLPKGFKDVGSYYAFIHRENQYV